VIISAQAAHPAGAAGSHLPRLPLSNSRRPYQDCLRRRWRDSATPSPDTAPTPLGSGTCGGRWTGLELWRHRSWREPFAPIQVQDQGVVSLVEKHPSEPAPGQSKCAG